MVNPAENRLAELRQRKELTRRDLAVALDVTEDTIRRFEENRGGPIPSKYIPTLTDLLASETDHLMGWDREPTAPVKETA